MAKKLSIHAEDGAYAGPASGLSKEDLIASVEAEVEAFSKFMSELADPVGGGPLNRMEKMLITSYLVHKGRGKF